MANFHPATIEAVVIGLDVVNRSDRLMEEFRSLHQRRVVKVIDMVVVSRDPDGTTSANGHTELPGDEAVQWQEFISQALGFKVGSQDFEAGLHWSGRTVVLGAEDVRFVADTLNPGQAAIAVVFEHCWASRLDDLIREDGVNLVEDDVFRPGEIEI